MKEEKNISQIEWEAFKFLLKPAIIVAVIIITASISLYLSYP